ncbi:MAG TPA: PHP domain-containing protein, partial [Thermoanaerobaculia bacterium]
MERRSRSSGNAPEMPPSRNLGVGNAGCGGHTGGAGEGDPLKLIVAAGARKERLRQREFQQSSPRPKPRYAELRVASAFSFLDGASLPEDLVEQAARCEIPAVALVDRNGVYGAPRFYKAAKAAGIKALVGAEVTLCGEAALSSRGAAATRDPFPSRNVTRKGSLAPFGMTDPRLTLLVENPTGYKNLCRLITAGALGRPKGETSVTLEQVAAHAGGLHCLTGGDEGLAARALLEGGLDAAGGLLDSLSEIFPGRLHVELQRHRLAAQEHRNRALADLAHARRLPMLATNGIRYARPKDKELHDVLTCIRHHTTLDKAGTLLSAQRERFFRTAAAMERRFSDLPQAIAATHELAERLDFTLADLGYRFPAYPLPPGETPSSYLRQVAWNGARARFRPLTSKAQAQITKELAMIEKLDLAGYFLIVWDVVRFCLENRILVQGRGSAANSAVCYALSITAVDPVKMELL